MLTKLHAYVGLALLLPLFIWSVTGAVFILKPGYQGAFEQLEVKTYPLNKSLALPVKAPWLAAEYKRTLLGWHLLVVDASGKRLHLQPQTFVEQPPPFLEAVKKLLDDSIAVNAERYGKVETITLDGEDYRAWTTTNVELQLNWSTLELRQSGGDSRFINRLYRMHYLQWTPKTTLNKALALGALLLLLVMCFISLRMLVSKHNWE